jgi:hypothetical protein
LHSVLKEGNSYPKAMLKAILSEPADTNLSSHGSGHCTK